MAQDETQTMLGAQRRSIEGVPASLGTRLSAQAIEILLSQALGALKAGTLRDLLDQRAKLTRWLARRYLMPVFGVLGAGADLRENPALAMSILLRWAVAQIRPDRLLHDAPISRACWLDRTSWRPMLAVACHYGLLAVPDFSDRYRRRQDESPADNLCGLWAIGPSTFYRYLEKGKRGIAANVLSRPLTGRERSSLREATEHEAEHAGEPGTVPDATQRRQARAQSAIAEGDYPSALWHLSRAGDVIGAVELVSRFEIELAADVETDVLLEQLRAQVSDTRQQFHLCLAQATLWNCRNVPDRTTQAYDRALHLSHVADDKLLLGIVHGALGKFYELRDMDRARACLEDCAEYLRQGYEGAVSEDAERVASEYVSALQKLAWIYVLRNDPRTKAVLERAQAVRGNASVPITLVALLEQTWGEYWRRSGDLARAIEHKLRALNLFERLGDRRQVLSTHNNLSIIYGEAKDYDRAIQYASSIIAMAEHAPIDPYIGASMRLNLGVAYFWKSDYDEAIRQYRLSLELSEQANLVVIANRARYNLAEAYYKRFQMSADPRDEARGDEFAQIVRAALPTERDAWLQEAAPRLKREVLGPAEGHVHERLWAEDKIDHFTEMAEIRRNRTLLALPSPPQDHIRAHLAIANAYLAISTKEREAAIALIRQHGLGSEFDSEIDALQMTFSRELTKEKVLQAQWKQKSYGVLTEERAGVVLKQVLEAGSINKSGYAQLCQVGLATASKHLGTLAERGLLVQTGKGPSTRYVLPA